MPTDSAVYSRHPAWVSASSNLPSLVALALAAMCACDEPSTYCETPIKVTFNRCEGLCNARPPAIAPGETITFEPRCLPPVETCVTTNICGTPPLDVEYTAIDDGGPVRVINASLSHGITVTALAKGIGAIMLFDLDGNSLGTGYLDVIPHPP
jgi:hypothetical protein